LSWGSFVRRTWWRFAIVGLLCGFFAVVSYSAGLSLVAGMGVGYLFGLIQASVQFFDQSRRVWPVTEEIINWDRVDELLATPSGRLPLR
jgi:hypothetical protein